MNHPVAICKVFDKNSFKSLDSHVQRNVLEEFVAPQTVINHNAKSCFCLAVSDSNRNKHSLNFFLWS